MLADLHCLHVALATQFDPAVTACVREQGHVATARQVLTNLRGSDRPFLSMIVTVVLLYLASIAFVVVWRGRRGAGGCADDECNPTRTKR